MPTYGGGADDDILTGGAGDDVMSGGGGADVLNGGGGNDIIYGFSAADAGPDSGAIQAHRLTSTTSGLLQPIFAGSPPGDGDHLFVLEQKTGKIQIVDTTTGAVASTPFLTIPAGQLSTTGEQGLLGMAFDPNYAANGKVYLDVVDAVGETQIWEYTRSAGNPLQLDPASKRIILTASHTVDQHYAGWIGFGPDGDLYIATGDGDDEGDPNHHAQDINDLQGKMLRIDVHSDDFPSDPNRNYHIPSDNPFVGKPGADEIWATGLRNPFRDSFDSATGDLYIADVGQDRREELDYVAAGTAGGLNFGWNAREGSLPYDPPNAPHDPSMTDPTLEYSHGPGPLSGHTIIGGYVYHGPGGAQGLYFFGDYTNNHLFATRVVNGHTQFFENLDAYLRVDAGKIDLISSFAQDGAGRLYMVGRDGEIFKLTPSEAAGDGGDSLNGGTGDDQLHGGAGDDILNGGTGSNLIDGGLGEDAASYSDAAGAVTVSVAITGAQNTGGAGTDTLTGIEDLIGSAFNDTLTGDGGNNVLDGGGGNDLLTGNGGVDTASYADAPSGVTVSLAIAGAQNTIGAGTDTLVGIASLTGSAFDDVLTGDGGPNTLTGGAGDDVLNGGLGANLLQGGDGEDTVSYADAAGGVTVSLAVAAAQTTGGAGTDTLVGIEDLRGSAFDDILTGDGDDNVLEGGAGDDLLDGAGGDDTVSYAHATGAVKVSLATNAAQNTGGAGKDTLHDFENLIGSAFADTLTGNGVANVLTGGDGADKLTGGAGDDTLYGGAGADKLDGGTGADVLVGGADDDSYTVDNSADQVIESAGGGTDKVSASASFVLSANVENLTLTGAAAINGTGNDLANKLAGNSAANVLMGLGGDDKIDGGAGADIMYGGTGNDSFTVDNTGDQVIENPGEGNDKVTSSVSFTLGDNVESLTLSGAANIDGTGNVLNNTLTGNAGANVLTGGAGADTLKGNDGDDTLIGGTGKDKLTGGNGADTFVFGPAAAADADSISDFTHGVDKLAFHSGDYGLPAGALSAGNLVFGPVATDNHAEFVYDAVHKALLWDPNGAGGAAAISVATFATAVTLSASDFIILA